MAVHDGLQAGESRADDAGVDFDFAPRGDVHFEDGEVYAVEGREESHEADDGDDACTAMYQSARMGCKDGKGREGGAM